MPVRGRVCKFSLMKWIASTIVLLTAAVAFSGCATVQHGSTQRIRVESSPAGAEVFVNRERAGVTPLDVNLSRSSAHQIRISKDGYREANSVVRPVRRQASERAVTFGWERGSGALNELVPAAVAVRLMPEFLDDEAIGMDLGNMASLVVAVDERYERGEISREEHAYLVRRIVEHFSR